MASLLPTLPQTAENVCAGNSISMIYTGGLSTDVYGRTPRMITVKVGQTFCVGDYVEVYRGMYGNSTFLLGTASMLKASYSSSNTDIAEVDKKGIVSAKAPGKTEIKTTYKGRTLVYTLYVTSADSSALSESYQKLERAAEKIEKAMPSKVTEKNADKLLKKRTDYLKLCKKLSVGINGFSSSNLVVPKASCFLRFSMMLDMYAIKNDPFAGGKLTKSAVSVKANTKQITLQLKKLLTKKQIQSIRIRHLVQRNYWFDPDLYAASNSNKVFFLCSIGQTKGKSYFSIDALGCAKKGSKTITVVGREYNVKKGKVENARLKKGKYILDIDGEEIKFKVK